jgi:hypothetical protein
MSLKRKKKVAAQEPEPNKITFTVGSDTAVFTIDIGNGLTLEVEMSREKANKLGQALIYDTNKPQLRIGGLADSALFIDWGMK